MKRVKIVSFLCSLLFMAFITVSQAQWTRQSPLPTGNELTDVCFINPDTGWIFGEQGAVYRTNDGGENWTDQSVPSGGRINTGFFLNTETGWVALSGSLEGDAGEIFRSADGGDHWELMFSDQSSAIRDLSFLNPDTGWALGYYQQVYPTTISWNFFLKTVNGGEDWLLFDFLEESHFTKMIFIDDTTGYVAGAGTPNLMKTTDGGYHWTSIAQPTNSGLTDVVFTDLNNGYTCGNNFYFTHNGGASWGYSYCYYANSIGMFDDLNGWTVTMNKVFRVREGGSVLDYLFTADKSPLVGISAVDSSTAYIVGKDVTIYSTTDGGASWLELSQGTNKSLFSVFFLDENEGWAGGADHTLLHTEDGGKHWIFNNLSASSGPVNDIQFKDARTGWFVNGNIYITIDSGATWNIALETNSTINDLYFIDNQTGWCVGSNGVLYKSPDGGMNWEGMNSNTIQDLNAVYFNDEENGWIAGNGIVEKTSDGGGTWEVSYIGNETFTKIQFPELTTGLILAGNHFLKTVSGGESWDIVKPEGMSDEDSLNDMVFINTNTGYLSGKDFLMKTTDGGQSWTSIPGFPGIQANAIYFVNENKGWMVGEDGAIFQTETGGAESVDEQVNSPETLQFIIFPNPANQILNFEFSVLNSGKNCLIYIFDVFGRQVYCEPLEKKTLNISSWQPGIYFIFIKDEHKILNNCKFVICR
jgi:photosystem II stability/assembly factor-like uncharacterized protein